MAKYFHSEPRETSKMEGFAETVNSSKALNIFAKHCILDVWKGSEYAAEFRATIILTVFDTSKSSESLCPSMCRKDFK